MSGNIINNTNEYRAMISSPYTTTWSGPGPSISATALAPPIATNKLMLKPTIVSSSEYFISPGEGLIVVSGNIDQTTLYLPDSPKDGSVVYVKKVGATKSCVVTIEPCSPNQTIDGLPFVVITPHRAGDPRAGRECIALVYVEELDAWVSI